MTPVGLVVSLVVHIRKLDSIRALLLRFTARVDRLSFLVLWEMQIGGCAKARIREAAHWTPKWSTLIHLVCASIMQVGVGARPLCGRCSNLPASRQGRIARRLEIRCMARESPVSGVLRR